MHYVIFIPNVSGSNPEFLSQVGLEVLGTDNASFAPWENASQTPGKKPGTIVAWLDPNRPDSNAPMSPKAWLDFQWTPCVACDAEKLPAKRFYIGLDKENPPPPDDLAREKQYDGWWIDLGDGNQWLIPAFTRLEYKFGLDKSGQVCRQPIPRWAAFIEKSQEIMTSVFAALDMSDVLEGNKEVVDELLSRDVKEVKIENGVVHACDALSINYRINMEIALHLGLMNDQTQACRAIQATMDLPGLLVAKEEKKSADTVAMPATSLV